MGGELDLIARHAGRRAGRRPDLRRIIGEGRQIVAVQRSLAGEFRPGELHAIARIAREPHDGILDVDVRPGSGGNRHLEMPPDRGTTDAIVTAFPRT
jgi:hypothetical protein